MKGGNKNVKKPFRSSNAAASNTPIKSRMNMPHILPRMKKPATRGGRANLIAGLLIDLQ
jgi:hypothetical protein